MTLADSSCRLDLGEEHSVVSLMPSINNARWGEIEKMGDATLGRIDEANVRRLVVDLAPLDFMGSSVVALIVRLWKDISNRKAGRMAVVVQSPVVLEVLEIAGLTKVWEIVNTRDEAIKLLSRGSQGKSTPEPNSRNDAPSSPMPTGSVWMSVFSLIALLGAILSFGTLLTPSPPLSQQVGLVIGTVFSTIGTILGGISVVRSSGIHKVVGAVVVLLCIGLGVAGVLNSI